MSAGVPLASWKTQMFESLLGFLPDWVQITVLALVVLGFLTAWALKLKRRIAARRARRTGAPVPSGPSGADFLGPYAPGTPWATRVVTPPVRAPGSRAAPTSSGRTPRAVRAATGPDPRDRPVIAAVRLMDRRPDGVPGVGGSKDGGPGPAHPVPPRAHATGACAGQYRGANTEEHR